MLITILACSGGSIAEEDVSTARLTADVKTLSSDEFAGRGTGEEGETRAAAFLDATLSELGVVPLPGQQSLIVPFQTWRPGFSSRLSLRSDQHPIHGVSDRDFEPFPFSDVGTADAEVVFAGYGIGAPEAEWDDYAGIDVAGRIVLVLRHLPHEDDEANPIGGQHALFTTKAKVAYDHGAIGMILVTDPLHHTEAEDFRNPNRLRLDKPEAKPNDPSEHLFLAVHASKGLVDSALAAVGLSLEGLQRSRDAGKTINGPIGLRASVTVEHAEPRLIEASNVLGMVPGTTHPDEIVVVGAHYDHLGTFPGEGDTIYNGADDNASGTAGMLELARHVARMPRARTVVFAGFSAEEQGLLGSKWTVDNALDIDDVALMLNMDMIGRHTDSVHVLGPAYGTGLREAVDAANAEVGLTLDHVGTRYRGNSDHHSFFVADVPFLSLFTGLHDDYHQLDDHADKLDYARMTDIVRLARGVVERVADRTVTPTFTHHVSWLGVAVDVVDGAATLTTVDPGSRAAKAGLQPGDTLTGFDGTALARAEDVGKALRAIEPGDDVVITSSRGEVTVQRAKTGYLGVYPGRVPGEVQKASGLASDEGVLLQRVMPKTPAAKAGLHSGDVLIRIAGLPVGRATLSRRLQSIGAGEAVDVVVVRDGARVELSMVLGERPD